MNKLLVYIQKIDEAAYLIEQGAALAEMLDKDLDILYTIGTQHYPMGLPGAARPSMQHSEKQIKKILDEVHIVLENTIENLSRDNEDAPKMNFYTKQGNSIEMLKEQLKKADYHYLLIKKQDDEHYPIDDMNMDIISHVDLPVLIIPEDKKLVPVTSIIYATDYNNEDIDTMKKLAVLAEPASAKITALHITSDLDFENKIKNAGYQELIGDQVGYTRIVTSILSPDKHKSLPHTIGEYAAENDADLLVVLKENKNFFDRLFHSSTTRQLVKQSDIPLLVYQENGER